MAKDDIFEGFNLVGEIVNKYSKTIGEKKTMVDVYQVMCRVKMQDGSFRIVTYAVDDWGRSNLPLGKQSIPVRVSVSQSGDRAFLNINKV